MSYCILPKKKNIFNIISKYNNKNTPYISFSLLNFLNKIKEKIVDEDIELFYKVINPYEFVHYKVINSNFSVSKIKAESEFFYIFMEVINSFSLLEFFLNKNIVVLHCGSHNISTIDCMNIFRENFNDINYDVTNILELISSPIVLQYKKIDFLYFEIDEKYDTDINKYTEYFISILHSILNYQNEDGICIIKINSLVYKPIIDIVYILTNIYDKVYINKPSICNIFKNERFIICKNFTNISNNEFSLKQCETIMNELKEKKDVFISSILENELPYYFLNKIEESNIIIGQQQLEHFDILVNIIKNKNREDKIETLKRNNIQKCILWCEKNKIPYNKFIDKLNIFLPLTNV